MPQKLQLVEFIGGPINGERKQVPCDAEHWRAIWPREESASVIRLEPVISHFNECHYERVAFYDSKLHRYELFLSSDCIAMLATHNIFQIKAIANKRKSAERHS